MNLRRSASVSAKSRIRFDAEVSVAARSVSRGEARSPVSLKPGGVSSTIFSTPRRTENGAAAQLSETVASSAARMRIGAIVRIILILGELQVGDDPKRAAQGEKNRHRLLGRPGHERGRTLDASERRDPLRLYREPRSA